MPSPPDETGILETLCERRHPSRGEAQPVSQLSWREASGGRYVLHGDYLDLLHSELSRSRRPVMTTRQLNAVYERAQLRLRRCGLVLLRGPWSVFSRRNMRYWLCTHCPTWSRMPGVDDTERFARNLRRERTRAGMSQEQLAERSGLHPTEVSRL